LMPRRPSHSNWRRLRTATIMVTAVLAALAVAPATITLREVSK
jgi:hypothetical protein